MSAGQRHPVGRLEGIADTLATAISTPRPAAADSVNATFETVISLPVNEADSTPPTA
jgi:hypothetical protein